MTHSSRVSRWRACLGWVAAASVGISAATTLAPTQAATPQEVDAAVDKAVAFLLSQQKPDGTWEAGMRFPQKRPLPPMTVKAGFIMAAKPPPRRLCTARRRRSARKPPHLKKGHRR